MTNSAEEKKIKRDGIRQLFSCLVVFIPILCGGMAAGWTSPTQKFLTEVNVKKSFTPFTMEEFSWINSFLYFGGMAGCLLWNPVTEKFGRKIAGYCVGLLTIASWSAIYVSMDFYVLLASRFALGISIVGSVVVGMAYSNEITSERLKGPLCSLGALYINIGFLVVYVCGSNFSYKTLNLICLAIPVVFLILFFRLPESPLYLMMDDQEEKAKKSMMWFRGNKVDKVGREIAAIQASPTYQIRITVKDLLTSKETAFSVFTAIMMFIGQQISGITIITSYAESIFKKSGTGISPEMSTIMMGLIQVGGCCLPGLLVNKVNLKYMLAGSFVSAALALAVLSGSYVLFEQGFQDPVTRMLPLISVLSYILSFTIGIAPIPFIMFTTMFKPNVMTLAISFGQLASNCSAFFLSKIFPSLIEYFDYSGTFALLAVFNLIMTAYVMKCVTYEASQLEKQLPPDILKSFENRDAEKLEVNLIINA